MIADDVALSLSKARVANLLGSLIGMACL